MLFIQITDVGKRSQLNTHTDPGIGNFIEVGFGRQGTGDAFDIGARAAKDALSGIRRFSLSVVLVYASVTHELREVLRGIRHVIGDVPVIGTTTAGEIANASCKGEVVVTAIASPYLSVRYAVATGVSTNWSAATDALVEAPSLAGLIGDDANRQHHLKREGISLFGMLFSPGNTQSASSYSYEILERIKAKTLGQLPIIGGASADDWQMNGNFVLADGNVYPDSVLLAVFSTQLQFGIALSHGFADGTRSMTVTAIDDHEVLKLDGEPAAEVVCRHFGQDRESLAGKHLTLTTGFTFGVADVMGQFSINVATYITPRGGIRFTQPIPVGATLKLMNPDFHGMAQAGQEAIRKAAIRGGIGRPAAIIVHHCALRERICAAATAAEIQGMLDLFPGVPLTGFHSFGEAGLLDDGTNRHNNASVSALVFGDGLSMAAQVAIENRRLQADLIAQTETLRDANLALATTANAQKETLDALQRLRGELEHRVDVRTRDLAEANARLLSEIGMRQANEQALSEQVQLTEALIKSLPGIFYHLDHNGRFLNWNKRFEIITGFSPAEMSQRVALDFFAGEDKGHVADRIKAVFSDGEASVEAGLVLKNGQAIPHFFTGRRNIQGGNAHLIGVGIDITERKQAEALLNEHRNQLQHLVDAQTADLLAAHERLVALQFAMDSVGIGIEFVDFETGRFVYVNRWEAEQLGYSVDEMLQLTVTDVNPNFDAQENAQIRKSIRELGHIRLETSHRAKDGHEFPVELTAHFQEGNEHHGPRVIVFVQNIAERKAVEQARLDAKEAAEAAYIAKSAFLANMSHEIRTPLNAIIGMAHLIRRAGLSQAQTAQMSKLVTASDHLLEVINAILDLSKIESGKFDLHERPLRLENLVNNVNSLLDGKLAAKRLRLARRIGELPRGLMGDDTRLQQALLNYLSNAVKFTDSGSIEVKIECLEENEHSALIRFSVTDTGIGIMPESLARLFNAFEQADNTLTRKYGGTGLGLAINRKIAHLMGGEVGAESTFGRGSTFWFTARLKKSAQHAGVPVETADSAESRLRREFSGTRILLVDDEPLNREIAQSLLEDALLDVDIAMDGEEAVALAEAGNYAAILMDMQMPGMDGLEATRQIRKLAGRCDTPIIAMTANAYIEDRERCLSAGMNDFLAKPIDPMALFDTLLKWVMTDPAQRRVS